VKKLTIRSSQDVVALRTGNEAIPVVITVELLFVELLGQLDPG